MKLKNHLLIVRTFLVNNIPIFNWFEVFFRLKFTKGNNKVNREKLPCAIRTPKFFKTVFTILSLFFYFMAYSQTLKPFKPRFDGDVKGSMVMLGNAILGKDNNNYNVVSGSSSYNENIDMKFIDIDSDPNTFSSSSANLIIPNPSCYRIAYAGLYWAATLQSANRTDINKIKLKLPGGSYQNITGEVVYDAILQPLGTDKNTPYSCYADVTSLLQSLTNAQGTYTVADVLATTGKNGTTGLSAGWNLIVVYEDPTKQSQSITTFDGFCGVDNGNSLTYKVSGFRARLSGPVNLAYAFAALEGDVDEVGTKLEVNNKAITTANRPSNHFFNSTIDNLAGPFTDRTPNSGNTLGFDSGIINVPNTTKNVVDNGDTEANISVQLAGGQKGSVYAYFSAFAVDIIAPEIVLTKQVQDAQGNDASSANVVLGQNLFYVIGFQNIGNDPATQFTIRDVLPNNIIFNYPADITYMPPGVTSTYDATTRSITFSIDKTLVEIGDPRYEIRFKVQVVPTCNQLSSACSNEIKNQAFATYRGVENLILVTDDPSLPSYTTCNINTVPSATNFLVGVSGCSYGDSQVLCGNNVLLTASNGYASYSWSRDPSGLPVIGTGQTFLATQLGKYYVHNTAAPPCFLNIVEEITVVPFGNTVINPVIPFADNVVTCPNDGKSLPLIYLCGANATRAIQTNVSDGSTIVWEKLNETSCAAVSNSNCANENTSCTWTQVGTGPNYTATAAGQYRMTLNYSGGCFNRFYFNVYQNLLSPTATKKDIVCNNPGRITVGGVPSGYEYSLSPTGPFQSSNVFDILTQNLYTVYIRQVGVTSNPCLFTVPNVFIRERNFTVSTVATSPLCNGGKGSLKLAANDVEPQYFYKISQSGTLINSVGPIQASDYTFANLNPGVYDVEVSTEDGCIQAFQATVPDTPLLTATVTLTKPLTCTNGEITVYPVGGTPPYVYYINSSANYEALPQIVIPSAGNYIVDVYDFNGCTTRVSIPVTRISPPTFDVVKTDIKCYNDNTGIINFNVTNANGYTLAYSIDNGVTYSSNPTFSNLIAGTYNAIVKYSLSGTDCFSTAQTITLTQPSTALTASAGVSELAGCGPSGEGKIRITNPQGGTLPYQYSFDNQATWTTANEAYKASGTYTVYIKDANGCIFAMPNIVIDPIPVEPTITVDQPAFNCDGTATSTVTVTNNGGANFSYEYLLDGALNTNVPSNVFTNVPSGSHTVSVSYKLLTVPTYSNLLKEDFGSGLEVSSPGINAAFCFEKQNFLTCDKNGTLNNGEYTVTNTIKNGIYSGWHNPIDHTSGSATGRYLAVDAGIAIPNNAVLYRKTINDIIPNQPIQVTFYATNLLKVGNTQPNASLTVELQNSSGTPLSSSSTGGIPKTDGWVRYDKTIDPGNNTTLDFVLRLEVAQVNGIDFAVDDIEVYQLPKACVTTKNFTVIIPTDEAFTAAVTGTKNITCAGTNNGEITISAQNFDTTKGFQYSIDNGVNWFTQMTSPYTITGLASGTYNVKIRYDVTSTGSCVKSFTQILTAPAALVTTASVSSLASCTAGATITASSTGGTLAYRYELWNAAGTTNIQPSQNTGIFTNVAPGTYIVRGNDANNCSDDTPVITVVTPPTLTATLDPSSDLCFDTVNQASLVVNVSGGTSPYVYSLDGAPAQNSNTFNNISVGNHSIIVTDSFGCTAPAITVTITPQLTAAITNIKELDCTASPNALITGTITGGNAPFVVTVLSGTGPGTIAYPTATTFTYTTAVASSYQFQITDSKGCITTTTATINPLVPVSATTTDVNPTCNGGSNGSVQIAPSGGVGPYTYNFNGLGSSGTTLYTGLQANVAYPYVVTDSKGCTFNGSVTLSQPVTISGNAVVTVPYTCLQNGTIEAQNVSGGTGVYSYSIDGITFQASPTFTGLTSGTYTITIKDVNNCPFVTPSVTIAPLTPPTDLTFNPSALSCPANTSNVTITSTTGGSAPLQYQITAPAGLATAYQGSNVFNGLAPGTYTFQVKDDKGCTYQENFTINALPAVTVVGQLVSNVQCLGSSTGVVRFTVSGATNFTYTINGVAQGVGTSPINLTGLAAGGYAIVITNTDTNCTATTSVTVNAPSAALAVDKTVTPIKCGTNGSVVIMATDGWGGYSYTLTQPDLTTVGPQSSATFSNLSQLGIYTISATDANNCLATDTFSLTTPVPPTASIAVASDLCYDATNQATIVVTASSGVSPYQYSIDNGVTYQLSDTFANLIPGNYSVMVKDAYGCTSVALAQTITTQLTVNTVLTKGLDCTASPDAVITGTITGGYSGFNYAVSINGGAYSAPVAVVGTTFTYTIPAAGFVAATTYRFQVTDASGCPATSGIITINPLVPVSATTTDVNPTCNGGSNGSVQIAPSGGVGPYSYNFNGLGSSGTTLYTGLMANVAYPYVVTDSKGCTFNGSVTLSQPVTISGIAVVTVPYTCLQNGTIEAQNVSGGTGVYSYSIDGITFQASPTFTGLTSGTYTITIKDVNNCPFVTPSVTIAPLTPPTDLTFNPSALSCPANTSNVTITSTTGGSAPLQYQITAPAGLATAYQGSNVFNGLAPGTYTFQVKDDKGCTYQENFTINALPAVTVVGQLVSNVQCLGSSTGVVRFTVSGATNFTYTINGVAQGVGTSPINLTGLAAGGYAIVITNTDTNCTATTSVTVNAPSAALAVDKTVTPIKCGTNGSVVIMATDGWGGYSYTLTQPDLTTVGPQSSATFSNLSQLGIYTISATDANNCLATDTFSLTTPVPPTASIAVASDLCYDATNQATIVVTASSGVSPYQYSIDNGVTYQLSDTFANLIPGNYSVMVKDAYGCTSVALAQTITTQLTVNTVLTKGLDCTASPDAVITGTITGGYSGFNYAVSINGGAYSAPVAVVGTTFTYTIPAAGFVAATTYRFQVTDASGCPATSGIITINPLVMPTGTATPTNLTCNGSANGSVTITPSLGVAPYTFSFNGSAFTSVFTYGGLAAGTYIYSVKDSKNCVFTSNVTVTEPALITFTPTVVNMSCSTAIIPGSIEVTGVTNGVAPFTYVVRNTVTGVTLTQTEPTGADYLFPNLSFGTYEITVTDSKGCSVTQTRPLLAPPSALIIDLSTPVLSCASGATIVVSVAPPAPPLPYQFGIYDMNVVPYSTDLALGDAGFPLQRTFTGLTPGVIYTFVVFDPNTGCYYFQKASGAIPPLTPLTSTINSVKPVTCKGTATGSVSFTVDNYTGTHVHYEIFYDQTNAVTGITGDISVAAPRSETPLINPLLKTLTPGTYYIKFTELVDGTNVGCTSASATFVITESMVVLDATATVDKNDNCNHTGQISAIAQGGTLPYQYELVGPVNIPYSNFSTFPNASSPATLIAGNYTVNVKDANGCIVPKPIILGLDSSPTVAAALNNQCTATEGNFVIDVSLLPLPAGQGIPPYSYSIDGGAYQNLVAPFSITGLSSGSHTVQVKDVNGCGNPAVTVPILAPLGLMPTVSTIVSCPSNVGAITANATGGSSTYTYAISPPAGTLVGNVFTNLPANTYTVTVTDAVTTCQISKTVVLDAPTPVTFSTTATDVSCFGDSNGTITVILPATNDNPTYTYTLTATSGPALVVGPQSSNIFTGLSARTYDITVTSGKGCNLTQSETVGTPLALLVDASSSVTAFGCAPNNSVNTATVTVNETAGTGTTPYTYSIDGTNYFTTNTFSIIDTGSPYNLTIYIKDANGCVATRTLPITPLPKITAASASVNAAIDCNNTGSLIVNVTGGSGNFTYQMLPGGTAQPSNIFTVTTPGNYYFRVNDVTTGCYFDTAAYTVVPFNTIDVVATATTAVTCFGDSNGAIAINVTGYGGAYNYEVFNSLGASVGTGTGNASTANPQPIAGLLAGNYTVVVTETASPFCVKTSNVVTIGSPSAAVSLSFTTVNDNCNVNAGQIVANAQGGTAPYLYQILPATATAPLVTGSGWTSTNTLNAESGNYVIYVKDANDCPQSIPVTIGLDPTPVVAAVLNAQCGIAEGQFAIDVTVPTAGIAPYSFSIDGGAYQNLVAPFSITGLSSGSHTVQVKDVNGCGNPAVTVPILAPLGLMPTVSTIVSCPSNVGAITANATGGSSTYTYAISPPAGTLVGNVFTNLPANTYTVTVTDAVTTCQISKTVVLDAPTPVTFSTTATDVSCFGDSNGTITVILPATNDNPTYTYTLTATSGPALVVGPQSSNIFTGLSARTYDITVTSGKGCNLTQSETVGTPLALLVDASSSVTAFGCAPNNSVNTATVTVNETAGTGTTPYTYSIDGTNYFTTNTFSIIDTGSPYNLTIYIKDANGCVATRTLPITPLPKITAASASVNAAIDCNNTGSLIVNVTGGSGNFTYQMLPGGTAQPSNIFTVTTPGNYYFRVNDVTTGCYFDTAAYTVVPFNTIDVVATATTAVTCFGDSNGAIAINVTGYGGAYNYEVFNSLGASVGTGTGNASTANPQPIAGLLAGNYTVVVTETASPFCVKTSNVVTIGSPSAAVSLSFTTVNDNCNVNAGQIVANAQGGTAPYLYQILPATATAPLVTGSGWTSTNTLNAESGNYVIYVKDANDCPQSIPVTIGLDPTPVVAAVLNAQCGIAEGQFAIDVTVPTAGIAPYSFSIDGGAYQNLVAPFSITGLSSGSHTVQVKDVNGCGNPAVTVPILAPLSLSPMITTLPSCANGDGTLTLSATGGSGNYEYSLDAGTPQSLANFTAISAGSHTVTVRDITTTCTKSIPVNLGAATAITGFALSKTDVSCNGGSNGVITATITRPSPGVNDNPVYNYSLSGTAIRPAQLSNIFSGLTTGNYTVTVTSARGCVATQTITVIEPAIITVPAPTVAQFGCNSGSNAMNFTTITVTGVTGGSGIYNYEFIKGGTVVQFGTNNVYTEANLLGGTYTVNVYDSKGCIGSAPATISIVPFIALDKINVAVNNAITCTNPEDITVSATTIGGTPASLQYTLVDVSGTIVFTPNTTGIFTGLPIGDYIITVTNPATGCSIQDVHYVNNPNTFDLIINSVTDVSCFGGTNGTANVTLIDRVITASNPNQAGAFSYTIVDTLGNPVPSGTSTTAGPLTINALAAGTYTITATLTNSPFCTVSKNFTISQPSAALTIAETHTAITCISGNNDGSISATATGGWPGAYQFELTGPVTVAYSSQNFFNNLTAGTYTINVKDSKGCVATTTVTLVIPTPIIATATPNTTLLSCFGDKNAIITVTNPTGGQGSNYSYTLNMISPTASSSGPQLSPIFSGLGAGTYSVTVKDGYNCSFTSANIVIAEPTVIKVNLVVASTQTCQNQTQLTLTASGGTAPYFYSTDNVTYSAASFAPSVTFPVAAGTYHYYVRDTNSCISYLSNDITIDPLPVLTINLDLTNAVINCKGDASGVIVAEAQGGLGNYIYSLLDGSGNPISPTPTQLSPGNFTALVTGNYMVKVDSGDCSKTSAIITIKEPLLQLAETHTLKNVSCNGAKNGEIVINASNGTGIIQYAISPNLNQFDDINTFKNLKPGNYDVIVQDQTGCFIKINFDITEPDLLTASTIPNSIVPEICAGDKDGAFSITIRGGSAPYSVSLDNPNGTYTTGALSQTDFDFTGLTGGNHVVYIRDAAGCNTDWSVLLPESIYMNPMATVNYDCVNNAAANSVTVTIDASVTNPADVDYSLDGGAYQPENIFTNLVPGTHYITTRHTNGCEQRTSDFNIVQVDPLTLVLNDGGLNEIVATAAGGGGNYQYTLDGESYGNTSNFIIYKSGDYTVTATDANGCVASATRHFGYIDVCIPNHFTPNGDGIEDGWAPGCTINYTNLTFDIFDRYGRKVATYRLGQYWDGKYDGKELPSGDYWYVLKLNDVKDPREFVGHFTLYR
ncbi:T9SS type B sorting domain-containing protein [Flavobacterium undicola]|uniref:T9SS type B sorting domain-containing protein n=1 Tax=Flavobacterium undicola TaxID=1932779 RepID=UPI0013789806|nr:T9SS type B sorting domain-containing protein [Flavobacterium undicola]MBA0882188.1 T9SS type B sorting domain-containing protein [Flavobacterium undicola]